MILNAQSAMEDFNLKMVFVLKIQAIQLNKDVSMLMKMVIVYYVFLVGPWEKREFVLITIQKK